MLTPVPCSAWLIAYDTANVLTHSPKRKLLPDPYTYAVEVPDGQPPVGLVTVPLSKSIVSLGVVVG